MSRIFIGITEEEAKELLALKLSPEMTKKIQYAVKHKEDFIHIIWSAGDIIERAKERKIKLTKKQAQEALGLAEHYHDCNYGISWETLDSHIDDVV